MLIYRCIDQCTCIICDYKMVLIECKFGWLVSHRLVVADFFRLCGFRQYHSWSFSLYLLMSLSLWLYPLMLIILMVWLLIIVAFEEATFIDVAFNVSTMPLLVMQLWLPISFDSASFYFCVFLIMWRSMMPLLVMASDGVAVGDIFRWCRFH